VHELPTRPRLSEHVVDVAGHRLLVANDSLPMHLAIGLQIPTVAIFTCTSPWEIHDYGLLRRVTSPMLERYFFSRENPPEAAEAIPVAVVVEEVESLLASAAGPQGHR
jgi:ADP-heptose:LPS heptosyltransferase